MINELIIKHGCLELFLSRNVESHEAKPYMRHPKEWGLVHGLNCFFKGTPDFSPLL